MADAYNPFPITTPIIEQCDGLLEKSVRAGIKGIEKMWPSLDDEQKKIASKNKMQYARILHDIESNR